MHGIWCMMFNMHFDGARGGGCPALQALIGMSTARSSVIIFRSGETTSNVHCCPWCDALI